MWKYISLLAAFSLLAACSTKHSSTAYAIGAYDSKGNLLSKRADVKSNEAGITTARDTLCQVDPRAVIRVTNHSNGEEMTQYSPYRCR